MYIPERYKRQAKIIENIEQSPNPTSDPEIIALGPLGALQIAPAKVPTNNMLQKKIALETNYSTQLLLEIFHDNLVSTRLPSAWHEYIGKTGL